MKMDSANNQGVGTFLGAAGVCPTIVHKGKSWKIGHPTQRAKAALEDLAVGKATEEVEAREGKISQKSFDKMFDRLCERVENGEYRTWGPGWKRMIFNGANAHLFLLALLRENHEDATESDAKALARAEPEKVQLALVRVVPGFFQVLLADLDLKPDQRAQVEAQVMAAIQPLLQAIQPSQSPEQQPEQPSTAISAA